MKNGNELISEQYDELTNYLWSNISHDNLDKTTIRSLIGSCAEFEGAGISKNTMVFPNLFSPEESVSVKFSNVKFSLNVAFDIVLLDPNKSMEDKTTMLLFVVRLLKLAYNNMIQKLDKDMTKVLHAVYMLSYDEHGATIEDIKRYCKDNKMDVRQMSSIIEQLEKIKCIKLDNGEYKLAETVILNL